MILTALLISLLVSGGLGAPAPVHLNELTKRATNQLIYAGRCISIEGGNTRIATDGSVNVYNGLPVVSLPCNQASTWDINPGSGSVLVGVQDPGVRRYALDASSYPGNGGALKVWELNPSLYQQTWYLTDDKRITITGGDQCLDQGDSGVQTWQCTTGNTNQIWNVIAPTPRNDPVPTRELA